ncbi:MAG: TonB-dependent receptor [Flavobacteriales bacterium]|jgi:hypothetical protein|nr:TonB-dependent receptor [Flavobacteriales bacterium]
MKNYLILGLVLLSYTLFAQQTIKGTVVDLESKFPLPGVNVVVISDTTQLLGAATDMNGKFKIENVSYGRHQVQITYMGYTPQVKTVIVNSAKEVVLNVSIEESALMMDEVVIESSNGRDVKNEMAVVSAQVFSVEETERYAGSRGDPARMASNFAGVSGSDDSRNDIVIRGNSPLGVLYRVEGVDIPNPNHFSVSGSTGGPTSIINNKILGNSDFFTGAFPAEFGNSTSGVFDLSLRAGNNENYEFTGQLGLFGTELLAEGPISKEKGSSFLMMYRYSTLVFFGKLGLDLGTSAIPYYQDLNFKLNFPLKKGGNVSLWSMSGLSNIDILISEQKNREELDTYGENDKDQHFGTGMAVGGITFSKPLNENTYVKSTLAMSREQQKSHHELVHRVVANEAGDFRLDSVTNYMKFTFNTTKFTSSSFVNTKVGKKGVLKAGYNADFFIANLRDSILDTANYVWNKRWDADESFALIQPYASYKYKATDNLVFTAGLHYSYFTLNNTVSGIEPRGGMKWTINDKNAISAGVGIHSQIQPVYTYYYILPGNQTPHNTEMGMNKSFHSVLGYTRQLSKKIGLKLETYYQELSNIPVEVRPSAFSLINGGSGFSRLFPDTLTNSGTGRNYGIEFTLQKYFSNNWYAMSTGAIYDSKFKGSNGVEYNTSFNNNFAINILAGKEFELSKNRTIGLGTKFTWGGGKRYGNVDIAKTTLTGDIIFEDDKFNEFQFQDYLRLDFKISFKKNAKKVTHEVAFDLVNVTNQQNILNLTYAPSANEIGNDAIRENYQLGFLPIFYYRIDF